MQCNKTSCIRYNPEHEDKCYLRKDLVEECIKEGHKDFREESEWQTQ